VSERDMTRLIALLEKQLGLAWVDVVEWLRDQNGMEVIEARLVSGDFTAVIAEVEAAALKFAAETHAAYVTSGSRAAAWLDAQPAVANKLIRFDITNARAVDAARVNQLELVQGFREESQQIAQQITQRALVEGAGSGINPRVMARDFRDSIGLTANQEQHVANARRALERGDWDNWMGRELRDARSDRTIARLRRDGGQLTQAQIDKLVEGYRKSYVAHRAETIARTEALRNAHEGSREGIRQAIERGDIEADQLTKEWHARRAGKRARKDHQKMDGVQVPWSEDFVLPDGARMSGPGDPRGGAKHNASCGCCESTSLAA